jgi:hypothetical protein
MESIAAGIMFVASDFPVEPAAVPVGVVLEVVVAAVPVNWLVDDCVAAVGAICKSKTPGQSSFDNYLIQTLSVCGKLLTKVPEKLCGNGVPGSTQIALIPTASTFPCMPIWPAKQQRYPVYPSEAAPSTFVVFQRFQLLSAQTGAA